MKEDVDEVVVQTAAAGLEMMLWNCLSDECGALIWKRIELFLTKTWRDGTGLAYESSIQPVCFLPNCCV